jgi:hypothetical protein
MFVFFFGIIFDTRQKPTQPTVLGLGPGLARARALDLLSASYEELPPPSRAAGDRR